jgi:hypothetical protein
MIRLVPTAGFVFPFTVNKLLLSVDLVSALLLQIQLAPLSRSGVECRSCHCRLRPSAPCREVDPIMALQ